MARISIVIPCYNSRKTITECLTAIRKSIYKDYEIVVVDDHSSDNTVEIAARYADKVIPLSENKGSGNARQVGMEQSSSDIICFVDSDVLIKPQTVSMIMSFLSQHPEVDAVTGLLSKEHPHQNFFSQYKNLYMNYIFNLLPDRVTFLFGSICALRKQAGCPGDNALRHTPDTEFGQRLFLGGKTIAFLKDLGVVHLKSYTPLSFFKNDFRVPFSWAKIFVRFAGWRQLGRNKTGFAHASRTQLASVVVTASVFFLAGASFFVPSAGIGLYFLSIFWLTLNIRFFVFLFRERGSAFLLTCVPVTFADQLVMAFGIVAGIYSELCSQFLCSIRNFRRSKVVHSEKCVL